MFYSLCIGIGTGVGTGALPKFSVCATPTLYVLYYKLIVPLSYMQFYLLCGMHINFHVSKIIKDCIGKIISYL